VLHVLLPGTIEAEKMHTVRVGIFVIVIGTYDDDRVYPENVARVMVSSQRSNTPTKRQKYLQCARDIIQI
jgi:hypothetical protein